MNAKTIQYLKSKDPILEQIIGRVKVLPSIEPNPLFHDVMACIIEQQIPYRSTKKLFEKLLSKADLVVLTPANYAQFERLALQDIKLSGRKLETIVRITQLFTEEDAKGADKDELIRLISTTKGIGNWTSEMLRLFNLVEADIFPADDYHLKNIMVELYELDPDQKLKAQMKEVAESWKPHRSLGVRLLLAFQEYRRLMK